MLVLTASPGKQQLCLCVACLYVRHEDWHFTGELNWILISVRIIIKDQSTLALFSIPKRLLCWLLFLYYLYNLGSLGKQREVYYIWLMEPKSRDAVGLPKGLRARNWKDFNIFSLPSPWPSLHICFIPLSGTLFYLFTLCRWESFYFLFCVVRIWWL